MSAYPARPRRFGLAPVLAAAFLSATLASFVLYDGPFARAPRGSLMIAAAPLSP